MILFSFSILLCFALVLSESHNIFQNSGESITLKCSTEGSPASTSGYEGLYLYHQGFKDKEEVLFASKRTPGVFERERYIDRIQAKGTPDNLSITISNLTKYDAGVYSCTYTKPAQDGITSNIYSVFIRESAGAASTECDPAADLQPKLSNDTFIVGSSSSTTSFANPENSLQLYLVVVACLITMLVTMIISVLVTLKVKQWRKRSTRRTQEVPNEYVYEDMRNHRSHLVADAEQLPVN